MLKIFQFQEGTEASLSPCIMCVQGIGGCSVHRRDTMITSGDTMSTSGDTTSTSGGYQEYIGGIPGVHRGDTRSTSGGYHEYIGGIS